MRRGLDYRGRSRAATCRKPRPQAARYLESAFGADEPDEPLEEAESPPDDFVSEEDEEDEPSELFDSEPFDSPFSPALAGFDDEYRSAYQPPPLRMKFPPLIWRFAVASPHLGQTVVGFSEIFWNSSHPLLQAVQTYS